jgi:transketolase
MQPNDQFVLSKGHAAGALYITLWTLGRIDELELSQFHKDNTRLSGHPPPTAIPEILFATGSLGHGLSLAAGLALGKRLKGESGHVYCLMSDGEWNEGSCWEALIFACHNRLSNLSLIVDLNGLQGFGSTRDVANLEPFAEKLRAFGASTQEVDGHDWAALNRALANDAALEMPQAVVARTRKGCGVSFMEGRMEWHYLPLTDALYRQALRELQ